MSARLSSSIAKASLALFAEHQLSTREVVGSNPRGGNVRDNTRAGRAFEPGTNAPRGPRPVISMRYAREIGASRRVKVTPTGTFAVERAVRPMKSAWRAYGMLLRLISPAAFAICFSSGYYMALHLDMYVAVANSIPALRLFEELPNPPP